MQKYNQLREILDIANKILITSHISPDADAISSILLAGTTLGANYPAKKVVMAMEEAPSRDLSFLSNYSQIQLSPLLDVVSGLNPDLIIIVDAMNFDRCSRNDAEIVRAEAKKLGSKLIVVDHHEEMDIEPGALYFNKKNPATAQELYELFFDELKLKKPDGYAQTTLLGIISDTARHKYDNPRHRETFKIVSELFDAGASIEQLENKLDRYNSKQMQAFAELAKNIKDSGHGYTYSFIDGDYDDEALKGAAEIFTSQFARNFENNNWGFVIYPELASGRNVYAISFRSVTGGADVAALAHKLGGGGHKQAAGAKITASSAQEALQFVQQAISETGVLLK